MRWREVETKRARYTSGIARARLFPWPFLFIPLLVVLRTDPRVASFDFADFSAPRASSIRIRFQTRCHRGRHVSLFKETGNVLWPWGFIAIRRLTTLINNVLNSSFQGLSNPWLVLFFASLFVRYCSVVSHILRNVIVRTRIGRSFKGTADSYTTLFTVPFALFILLAINLSVPTLILCSRRTGSDEWCFFQLLFVEIRRWQRAATTFESNNSHCPSLPGDFFSGTTTIGASSPTTSNGE